MKQNLLIMMKKDKTFLRRCAMITIPIALQGLLNNILNFVDTLMIGKLGKTTVSAVGLANKVFFVLSLLIFGICSGASILASQYWGKRDKKNIHRVLGMALLLGTTGAFIFNIVSYLQPNLVMSIFTNHNGMVEVGAKYLRIVCFSYVLTAVTQVFMSSLRSVNEVKLPVIISSIAIVTNVILNYILIFGHFGAPKLGVAGAAIATLIARIVECISMVLFVYLKKSPIAATPREMLSFDIAFIKKFAKTVSPVILNEFMWGLGVTMYSLAYGRMGEDATAAITVTQSIEQIMQVVFLSISNAAAIMLGNELGAGKLEEANIHSKYFIVLQSIMTVGIIILGLIVKNPIIRMFGMDEDVNILISRCFTMFLIFLLFKVFNTMNIVGILRSGGDTKASLFIDISGVWMIGIPMAFLGGLVFKLPIYIVYGMVLLEEVYKMAIGIPRYKKRKWLRNLVAE